MRVVLVEVNGVVTRMIPVDKSLKVILQEVLCDLEYRDGKIIESDIRSSDDNVYGHVKKYLGNMDRIDTIRFSTFKISDEDIKLCYEKIKEEEK